MSKFTFGLVAECIRSVVKALRSTEQDYAILPDSTPSYGKRTQLKITVTCSLTWQTDPENMASKTLILPDWAPTKIMHYGLHNYVRGHILMIHLHSSKFPLPSVYPLCHSWD